MTTSIDLNSTLSTTGFYGAMLIMLGEAIVFPQDADQPVVGESINGVTVDHRHRLRRDQGVDDSFIHRPDSHQGDVRVHELA